MEHGPALLVEPSWHAAYNAARVVAQPGNIEAVPVDDAVGRVLAAPLLARTQLPVAPTAAMDGWAVGGPNGPWRIVGTAVAGHPADVSLVAGTAVVIGTGAVTPWGTYAVIRREDGTVREDNDGAMLTVPGTVGAIARGAHIRPPGEEIGTGEPLFEPGTLLTPPRLGFAAMTGVDKVFVYAQITGELAVIGDEVLSTGVPSLGRVRDAFGPALPGIARSIGMDITRVRYVPDTLEAAVEAITTATADVLITTGGTEHGPTDFLHQALVAAQAPLIVDRVAMRPGRPSLLAYLGNNRFVIGLPGNPLAAVSGMLTLGVPLVRAMGGLGAQEFGQVWTAEAVSAPDSSFRLVPYTRVESADGPSAKPTEWLGSGMLRGLAVADGVMLIPPGGVDEGTEVDDIPLPWLRTSL